MTDSFERFRQQLAGQVEMAQKVGVPEGYIVAGAEHIGDWLAKTADARNPEQRLLKELWQVSDAEERQAIASSLVKIAGGTR